MSWTETTRRQYRRDGLRYASDLTEEEWQSIAPHLPAAKPLGRRVTDRREVVNAMLYLLTTGCQWRLLPTDFPPGTTVQRFFHGWRDDGTWRRINHHLLLAAREAMGRETSPSVKTTEAGGPRGHDAGKKVNGRKRHILTDTNGLLVAAMVHEADILWDVESGSKAKNATVMIGGAMVRSKTGQRRAYLVRYKFRKL